MDNKGNTCQVCKSTDLDKYDSIEVSKVTKYDNEALNLTLLMEECSEVIQAVSKIVRFGWSTYNSEMSVPTCNKAILEQELGDLQAIITILEANGSVESNMVRRASLSKIERLGKYYTQPKSGLAPSV